MWADQGAMQEIRGFFEYRNACFIKTLEEILSSQFTSGTTVA